MRRRRQSRTPLLDSGLSACALGVGMLLVPALLRGSPMFQGIASTIRSLSWMPLGFGVLLLAIHFAVDFIRSRRPVSTSMRGKPSKPYVRAAHQSHPVRFRPKPDPGIPAFDRVMAEYGQGSSDSVKPSAVGGRSEAARVVSPRPTRWGPEVFDAIEWRRFEQVCEALFAQAGFRVESHPVGADEGVDIWLHSAHSPDPVAVVQCKHWHEKQVPVKALREFLGVMTAHGVARGTYATSSTFTPKALQFTRDNGINAQDGNGLLRLIAERTQQQQADLLAVALDGDYWRPTCPSCNVKMVERAAHKTGNAFWGCPHYPRCKFTLPLAAAGRKP